MFLKKLMKKYNKKIVYILHRNEKIEKFNDMQNIVIKKLDYPIELYGINEKEIPLRIISFFSTALYTMKLIYKETEVLYIYHSFKNNKLYETIEEIYNFQKKYMKAIDLNA
jgi:hypothetical protein